MLKFFCTNFIVSWEACNQKSDNITICWYTTVVLGQPTGWLPEQGVCFVSVWGFECDQVFWPVNALCSVDDSFHAKLSNYLGGAINVDLDAVSAGDTKLEELQKLIASSSRDLNKWVVQ